VQNSFKVLPELHVLSWRAVRYIYNIIELCVCVCVLYISALNHHIS